MTITPSIPTQQIPLIDFGQFLQGQASARQQIAQEVDQACRRVGFFYIYNHNISPTLIAQAFSASRRFFALPMVEKKNHCN